MEQINYDENELRYIENQGHFDSNQSVFLARQLTQIRSQVLTVKKAPMNAFAVFPVQTEISEGAETAIQRVYDSVGVAEIIANYADDLRRTDVVAQETSTKVYSVGDAYGYNEVEIMNAMFAGVNLDGMKAQAARRGIDLKLNKLAWKGDAAYGITGFLNNPNIGSFVLPADGAGGSTKLKDKTEAQIIRDMNDFLRAVSVATNEVETINTVGMAPDVFAFLNMTRLSDSDRTLMDFIKQVHPEVTRWMPIGELKGAGTGGKDMMFAGYFDPAYIRFEIPMRFKQLPVERRNLEYVVNCMARTIGVTVSMPFAFVTAEGC